MTRTVTITCDCCGGDATGAYGVAVVVTSLRERTSMDEVAEVVARNLGRELPGLPDWHAHVCRGCVADHGWMAACQAAAHVAPGGPGSTGSPEGWEGCPTEGRS